MCCGGAAGAAQYHPVSACQLVKVTCCAVTPCHQNLMQEFLHAAACMLRLSCFY
jgi:hypothetical protein